MPDEMHRAMVITNSMSDARFYIEKLRLLRRKSPATTSPPDILNATRYLSVLQGFQMGTVRITSGHPNFNEANLACHPALPTVRLLKAINTTREILQIAKHTQDQLIAFVSLTGLTCALPRSAQIFSGRVYHFKQSQAESSFSSSNSFWH